MNQLDDAMAVKHDKNREVSSFALWFRGPNRLFSLIVLVILLSSSLLTLALLSLGTAVENFTKRTVPEQNLLATLGRHLLSFENAAELVINNVQALDLERINNPLQKEKQDLLETISRLPENFSQHGMSLRENIIALNQVAERISTHALERNINRARARELALEMQDRITDLLIALESYHILSQRDRSESGEEVFSYTAVDTVTAITLTLINFEQKLSQLNVTDSLQAARKHLNHIDHDFKELATTLQEMPDNDFRQQLSNTVSELYSTYKDNQGFKDSQLRYFQEQESLEEIKASLDSRLHASRTEIENAIRSSLSEYSRSLESITHRGRIAFLVLTLTSFGLIIVLIWLIRNQVLEPLRGITHAVKKMETKEKHNTSPSSERDLFEAQKSIEILENVAKELRRREQSLTEKNEALEKSNENLKTFTRVASHDLKTPLRGINILCELIEEAIRERDDTSTKKHLLSIQTRSSRLFALLDSLLDYAKAGDEMGKLTHAFPENLIAYQIDAMIDPSKCKISLKPLGEKVSLHEAPFCTVMRNLINNAIKHHDSDEKAINIDLALYDPSTLTVNVEDNGPGIPAEYQRRIFEPFETLKPKDMVEGSGLGLSISQKICQSLGTKLEVVSPVRNGRGTRFMFHWPITEARENKIFENRDL